MKFTKYIIGLLAILAMAVTLTATAAPPDPQNYFAVGSTNNGAATAHVIISARSASGGAPRVTFINAGSDTNSANFGVLQFYNVLSQAIVNYTNSTTTLYVVSTNSGYAWTNGTGIIRHVLSDTYEKVTFNSNTGSTNLAVLIAPQTTTVPGDIVYVVGTTGAGSIQWGAVTNSLSAPQGIYIGQRDKPLMITINANQGLKGTALNLVSGDYVR